MEPGSLLEGRSESEGNPPPAQFPLLLLEAKTLPALPTGWSHSVIGSCGPRGESRIKIQPSDQTLSQVVCWLCNIPNITIMLTF